MSIELRRVPAQDRETFDRLIDDYLAELSRHREIQVGPTRAAEYVYLPLYWTEAGRHPYLAVEGEADVAGLVLVRELDAARGRVAQMSEFYVVPERRRAGLGRKMVAAVFQRFPGRWELQVHIRNAAAMAFWANQVAVHASGESDVQEVLEADGRRLEYRFRVGA